MFQSIAQRAADPRSELPNFSNHITSSQFNNINEKVRNKTTLSLLKRCEETFPVRENVKKSKLDKTKIFENKTTENEEENDKMKLDSGDLDSGLQEILVEKRELSKVRIWHKSPEF